MAAPEDHLPEQSRAKDAQNLMSHTCIPARMPSASIYRWEFEQDGKVFIGIALLAPLLTDRSIMAYDDLRGETKRIR
jgi:hypothetical protein